MAANHLAATEVKTVMKLNNKEINLDAEEIIRMEKKEGVAGRPRCVQTDGGNMGQVVGLWFHACACSERSQN